MVVVDGNCSLWRRPFLELFATIRQRTGGVSRRPQANCPEENVSHGFRAARYTVPLGRGRVSVGAWWMERGTTGPSQPGRQGWTLFHLVTSMHPQLDDFRSMLGQGQFPKYRLDQPETYRQAAGVSCYATADQARDLARRVPALGSFVARVFIPDDACAIEVARTGRGGHHTVWASPSYFLSRIVSM
jgi:hypothetical protein